MIFVTVLYIICILAKDKSDLKIFECIKFAENCRNAILITGALLMVPTLQSMYVRKLQGLNRNTTISVNTALCVHILVLVFWD